MVEVYGLQLKNTDFLVVGAGPSGAVIAERIANILGKSVTVIDKRGHIAGNLYDYVDENGVMVHRYGPHAFHTNSEKIWSYLSNFTKWHIYFHRVNAIVDGVEVPLPFNLNSIDKLFPKEMASRLSDKLIGKYGYGMKVPILEMLKENDGDIAFLAKYIYDKVFLGYTQKQWGLSPEQIDPSVTARVPVLLSRDDRYFQDRFQGIPENGYTRMIENMLNNPLIEVRLKTSMSDILDNVKFKHLVYTGPIDEFFGGKYGLLPYRSLDFDFRSYNKPFFQKVAQLNYPENFDFTRTTEYKHFLQQNTDKTTVSFEYPEQYVPGENEPYYPINSKDSSELLRKYLEEAAKLNNTTFVGRLADYRYYNMDQVVARALDVFDKQISPKYR